MSFEKDQAFWRNASESLDEDGYLEFVKVNTRKPIDVEKFNRSFYEENEFWKNASKSLDEEGFEKLVEEECLEDPFESTMEIDFEPYLNLFKKGHKFWDLATKNLQDQEYEKLVQIYIASEKITWNNLTSDAFLSQPNHKNRNGQKSKNDSTTSNPASNDDRLTCNFCFRRFKQFDALQKHREMHTGF